MGLIKYFRQRGYLLVLAGTHDADFDKASSASSKAAFVLRFVLGLIIHLVRNQSGSDRKV
jgi:hypothetical protein